MTRCTWIWSGLALALLLTVPANARKSVAKKAAPAAVEQISIDRINGQQASAVKEAAFAKTISGHVVTRKPGFLYLLTRTPGADWHVNYPVLYISSNRSAAAQHWGISNVSWGALGAADTSVEVCAVLSTSPLIAESINDSWLHYSSVLRSPTLRLRLAAVGTLPLATTPRVRILTLNDRPAVPGVTLSSQRMAEVVIQMQDVPRGTYVQTIVQPVENETRWASRKFTPPPDDTGRQTETIYFGREANAEDARDDHQWFWVYAIVCRKKLPSSEAGISPDVWDASYQPYILARSDVIKVWRSGRRSDVQIFIDELGGMGIDAGQLGVNGQGPIEVNREAQCTGHIFIPDELDPTTAATIKNAKIWLLITKYDNAGDHGWRVAGGPVYYRSDESWSIPALVFSQLDHAPNDHWYCIAILGDGLPIARGNPVSDLLLSRCAAISDTVWVTPKSY
jgi:hypothetical protein